LAGGRGGQRYFFLDSPMIFKTCYAVLIFPYQKALNSFKKNPINNI